MPKSRDLLTPLGASSDAVPGASERRVLRRKLCRWYREEKRDLPWRRTRDAYAIWISEAMLQQTRVETVIDYHARFLARFPSLEHLARAEEQEVLTVWSGLGYYRRARSLLCAARRVMEEHDGVFPASREACLDLPGVGPYTAGAVLSMAYQRAEPLVDGNVARVFARLFAITEEVDRGATQRVLWKLAAALVPAAVDATQAVLPDECPGNWNQALMELGALVCTPREPGCDACPLRADCRARRMGLVGELPRRAARRASVDVALEILLPRNAQRVLLIQRPQSGRMASLWELPTREVPTEEGLCHALWPTEFVGERLEVREELGSLRHAITHHRIRASVWSAERSARPATVQSAEAVPQRWFAVEELREIGVTGLTKKCLQRFLS